MYEKKPDQIAVTGRTPVNFTLARVKKAMTSPFDFFGFVQLGTDSCGGKSNLKTQKKPGDYKTKNHFKQ